MAAIAMISNVNQDGNRLAFMLRGSSLEREVTQERHQLVPQCYALAMMLVLGTMNVRLCRNRNERAIVGATLVG
tara:strand:+ start:781 stop:1002 length:222 start_codon:yes stop_codon:yes gene_type:complete